MPAPEVDSKYQLCLLWPGIGGVDQYGQPLVGPPFETRCRFTRGRKEARKPDGTTVMLDGEAFFNIFIPIHSHMWVAPEGTLAGDALRYWMGTGSVLPNDEKMIVVGFTGTPDIKTRFTQRGVQLQKYHGGGNVG